MKTTQISVFLENRAGQLANITKVLAENGIDLRAINIAETADYGVLRLIADDTEKAPKVLLENGFIIATTPVIAVTVPDRPGGLNALLEALAEENIDIEYMYSVFSGAQGKAKMIFHVADTDKAIELLSKHDFKAE